jgi:hypothetical protein
MHCVRLIEPTTGRSSTFLSLASNLRLHLTQCINLMVSLKSIYKQTRQLNFMSENKLTILWVT